MSVTQRIGKYEVDYSKSLGQGSYGVVYGGTDLTDGKKIAVKRITASNEKNAVLVNNTIELLKKLTYKHRNIVRIYDTTLINENFYIFMEYCHTNLGTYFKTNKDMDLHGRLEIMLQIARGVQVLHHSGITHRDIKPQNVLVVDVDSDSPCCCKLADFDLSKYIDPDITLMSTDCGTPMFKAPEFWSKKEDEGENECFQRKVIYGRDVDIYAMGLLFLGLLQQLKSRQRSIRPCLETYSNISEKCGSTPIGETIHRRMIDKGNKESLDVVKIDETDGEEMELMKGLIRRMTSAYPSNRPSVWNVVQDLYLLIAMTKEMPAINICEMIFHGIFGPVYRAWDSKENRIAVKTIDSAAYGLQIIKNVLNLKSTLGGKHRNILEILDVGCHRKTFFIIMPLCYGNLKEYIQFKSQSTLETRLNIMLQIAKGLQFVHQKGIVHRNIKPERILVKTVTEDPPHILLAGLDISIHTQPKSSISSHITFGKRYQAPEMWMLQANGRPKYGREVDIYSAGLVFLGLLQNFERKNKNTHIILETPMHESEINEWIGNIIYHRMKMNRYYNLTKPLPLHIVAENDNFKEHNEIRQLIKKTTEAELQNRLTASQAVDELEELIKRYYGELKPVDDLKEPDDNLEEMEPSAKPTDSTDRELEDIEKGEGIITKENENHTLKINIARIKNSDYQDNIPSNLPELNTLPLKLMQEDDNEFDRNAIQIFLKIKTEMKCIGYIPGRHIGRVTHAMVKREIRQIKLVDLRECFESEQRAIVTIAYLAITKVGEWHKCDFDYEPNSPITII